MHLRSPLRPSGGQRTRVASFRCPWRSDAAASARCPDPCALERWWFTHPSGETGRVNPSVASERSRASQEWPRPLLASVLEQVQSEAWHLRLMQWSGYLNSRSAAGMRGLLLVAPFEAHIQRGTDVLRQSDYGVGGGIGAHPLVGKACLWQIFVAVVVFCSWHDVHGAPPPELRGCMWPSASWPRRGEPLTPCRASIRSRSAIGKCSMWIGNPAPACWMTLPESRAWSGAGNADRHSRHPARHGMMLPLVARQPTTQFRNSTRYGNRT